MPAFIKGSELDFTASLQAVTEFCSGAEGHVAGGVDGSFEGVRHNADNEANGVVKGVSAYGITTLAPKNNATRAQIASIIMRYLEQ